MNQRRSRNANSKNNLDFMAFNTGGHAARHAPNEDAQVLTPQKVTGEIKPEVPAGAAKASPNFKQITPAKPESKQAEKKVIAENSTPVVDGDEKKNDATE